MSLKIKNKQIQIVTDFDINNNRLINVESPQNDLDAANKQYVDSKIGGFDYASTNIGMIANSGTSGIYLATDTAILEENTTNIKVDINGLSVIVGNGTINAYCFFSNDDGVSAKTYDNITQGDELYWNGDIAGYQLDNSDLIDFIYMTI